MTSFIEVSCRCGRMVRTTPDQGGKTVRCWNCSSDVHVPSQGTAVKMLGEFAAAARNTLRPQALGLAMGVALGMTAVLMIPYVGNWLALGVLVVGARLYQNMIRENIRPRAGGPNDLEDAEPPDSVQWGVSALAAAALLAPFWARDWSRALNVPARWALVASGFACWLVVPLALYVLNARDRHGVVPPRAALAALARHPLATLATLLVLPIGLCLLEAATVTIARGEDYLSRMVDDLFPAPSFATLQDRVGVLYRYDDQTRAVMFGTESSTAFSVYRAAVSRGYTLTGSIPRSLSGHMDTMAEVFAYSDLDVGYLGIRAALTILILAGAATFLSIQARWLGLIALYGTRRAGGGGAEPARPQHHLTPSPAPVLSPTLSPSPLPFKFPFQSPSPSPAAGPIPLADAPVAPAPPAFGAFTASPPPSTRASTAWTILIVDSDRGFAIDLARVLSGRGFGVILAGAPSEAMAIVTGARPDLVVLDTMLHDRTGIQLCHEIRSTMPGPDRPVLIATSMTATSAEISAMATAADDYMIKPYVIEALLLRINQHLKISS